MHKIIPSALRRSVIGAASLFALLNAGNAQAQFSNGNIVVLQVGDGAAALTNASSQVSLKEYNTATAGQSTPVTTLNLPVTGSNKLTLSGTATSEGQMILSPDSLKLVIAGYDTTTGIASPNNITAALLARIADTVSYRAIAGRAVATNTAFSANNIRCVARNNNENYWAAGANSGTYYMGATATAAAIQTAVTNTRVVIAANNNLYVSTSSGTPGILKISGQPVTAATAAVLIATGAGSSPYGFSVNAAENVAYISDDRTNGSGGIYKWTLSGSVWSPVDTLKPTATTGTRSVVVDWSGTYPSIYAVTTDNKLIRWNDSANMAHIATILATAPANTAFRSVAFTPKAPLSCTNPVLSAVATDKTCTANGTVTLTVTSGTTPTGFAWTGPLGYTASTQNITNLQPGTYNLTATTPGGCSATASATVANNVATITAPIAPSGSVTFCQNAIVPLTTTTVTGYTYQWNNASGPISGQTNATYTPTASGSYTVTVSSGVNCSATSTATNVTINPVPQSTLTASTAGPICPAVVTFKTVSAPNVTYSWKYMNTFPLPGATDSTLNLFLDNLTQTPAPYSVKVIVTSAAGCMDSSTIAITVNPKPLNTVARSGPLEFCFGDSVILSASNVAGYTYQWMNATGPVAGATNDSLIVKNADQYRVGIVNSYGCTDTSLRFNTSVVTVGTPAVTYTGGVLSSTSTFTTYQWYLNGTAIPSATNQTYTPTVNGDYTLVVTNATGCSGTSLQITVAGLSIGNVPGAAGISLYPNPAHDMLYVKSGIDVNIVIKDLQGRTVHTAEQTRQVNLSGISSGIYSITLYKTNGDFLFTQKLVKAD